MAKTELRGLKSSRAGSLLVSAAAKCLKIRLYPRVKKPCICTFYIIFFSFSDKKEKEKKLVMLMINNGGSQRINLLLTHFFFF